MNKSLVSLGNRLKLSFAKLTRFRILSETRSYILFWYVILMVFFVAASIPATRQRLNARINTRVISELENELEKFEEMLVESLLQSAMEEDNLSSSSKNHIIYQVFDDFLRNTIAEDDNFLIGIVDGEFYKASSRFLPEIIDADSELMQRWENLTEAEAQEIFIPDPDIGSIIYQAMPIKTSDETLGVFVIAHATAGERKEAVEAINVLIEVLILISAIALVLAWFATGRILAPLKQLNNTLKSINESDLTRRIKIRGEGELAQLGNTFNEMMNRLESAFTTQSNFINDAGHELKTPITIIRGHLELIDDDPQEQQETIDLVIDELDRMNRLVEDLILLAKVERPDFLQIETIDLAAFIPELFNKLQALGQRNWYLENDLSAVKMMGDRQRITQAIINLANNAVQHTNTNSLIVLGAKLDGDRVALWIRDTGEGIAADQQQRIFDRFARVKTTPRRSEGSGLGLAIVKAIVEAHEGWINLQSQLGVGSTFTLIFPLEFKQK